MLAACGGGGAAPTEPTEEPAEAVEATPEEEMMEEEATPEEEMMEEEATPEEEMTEEEGAVTDPMEDPLGVVELGADDPFTLGYLLVTSGPNASLGIDEQRGIELAIMDYGEEFMGRPIELVGEDSLCSPEGGQAGATRLVTNEQIVGIIGATCSSAGRVAAPIVTEAGMTMISPSNTAPDLTDPASHEDGFLRTAHNDTVQGNIAADYAYNTVGVTSAATIHDGSIYAEQLANVFAESFQDLGGEIVAQEAVNAGDTDMRPVLTSIASQEPDLIYYPIFIAEGGFITSQAQEISGLEEVVLMGADGLYSPDFIDAAGDAAVGMYLSSPDFSAFGSAYQDFVQAYQEAYGEEPLSVYHAHAYDAAMMIFNAAEQVAVEQDDGTLLIPRQALRDALYATDGLQGLTGSLTCDENGDCADPSIAVYEVVASDTGQWPDGVVNKVYPEAAAASE
jgi:branched-chain amino acid transport system substrate-binding protein